MRYLSYLTKESDLENIDIQDFIVSTKEFGKFSTNTYDEIISLTKKCREVRPSSRIFFEWDTLQTQEEFDKKSALISTYDLSLFDAIRVLEAGALNFIDENFDLPIQIILESGNHNLKGILAWERHFGSRLERVILGLELPKELLKKYSDVLTVPTEIQSLGSLLLFYSPRSLLKNKIEFDPKEKQNNWYSALANSEETPHKGFQIIENDHGTFMLHPKKHSLMDALDEIVGLGIKNLKVDLRLFEENLNQLDLKKDVKVQFENDHFIKGYFNVNKTDKIFVKLKNHRLLRKDNDFIGTVVDVKKDQYIAVNIQSRKNNLALGKRVKFLMPEGKTKHMPINSLKNISLEKITQIRKEKIVLIPHTSGVSVKTRVHIAPADENPSI